MANIDIPVKCTRCRHACTESDWINVPSKRFVGCEEKACPRCGCKSYYDCTPQVAWCWASGLIEFGDALPPDAPDGGGAIHIAGGPKYALKGKLGAVSIHGKGASVGKLLVQGVPEAYSSEARVAALRNWLDWCKKGPARDGVRFS